MTTSVVKGTCHHDCPDSCGWVATVEDGVAVRLRGNPEHPFSRGELCPKVNRFLDRVYSPDRVLHPLVRDGDKGDGRFRTATWDEALGLVAGRLHEAVDRHGGESILGWSSAGNQGVLSLSGLSARFLDRVGASVQSGSLCGAVASAGTSEVYGDGRGMDPADVRHSRLIILWGTNTRMTNRHLWPFVEEARGRGATVVVVDPLRTITAASADWFVRPLPGTDLALALALMHSLVRDDLIDHDYIGRHTTGFDDLRARVEPWTPARAAQVCGLDAGEIERLAHAYGTVRPSAIRVLIGAEHREQGGALYEALASLPLLTGAWRDRGGGYARSVGVWSRTAVDDAALGPPPDRSGRPARRLNMVRLGRSLTDPALDPPVVVLLVWNGNPLVSVPNAELVRRGLAREDLFCVVHEQFVTDTARYADVVLPATTQLEQRDVVAAWGHLYLGWNEPAIEPQGEAVSNTELFRRLASAMGFTEPELFATDDELLDAALHRLSPAARDALRADGFTRLPVPEDLRPYAEGGFATPDGRARLRAPDYRPAGEVPGGDAGFPLVLLTAKSHTRFLNTSYSHLPKHGPAEGEPRLQITGSDARSRGIADGAQVRVWNDRGQVRLTAQVSDAVRAGVVCMPFGWWRDQHLSGTSANALTSDALTDLGGGSAFHDTWVEVAPA
jgi:anaerobic selenocysteine-containing dehydrogenase